MRVCVYACACIIYYYIYRRRGTPTHSLNLSRFIRMEKKIAFGIITRNIHIV